MHKNLIQQLAFVPNIPAIIMDYASKGDMNSFLRGQQSLIGKFLI
jgi:hypothetical protein